MLNLNDHVLRIVTSRNSKDELFDHTHSHRRRHSHGSWSDGHRELYDLESDPEELHEVSADQAEVVEALTQKLKALPAFTP